MAIPTGIESGGGGSSRTVPNIPTTTAGGGNIATQSGGNIATTGGGTNTAGGSYWYDSAAQYAMYLGNIELQKLLEQGVNERFAKQMADNEANRSLQRSIATGYINGDPTLDRQVQEWNRQNQLWNQGYQEQQLGLDYAKTLASLTGPRDWLKYSNMLRNTANSYLPGYLKALQSGSALAASQSTLGTTSGQNAWQNNGGQLPGYENAQNAQYVPPWLRNYGGFSAGGYNGWKGSGSAGGGLDYASAIARARSALGGMDARWNNATDAEIVAEIQSNPSLFVNDPIRNAIVGGGQYGVPDAHITPAWQPNQPTQYTIQGGGQQGTPQERAYAQIEQPSWSPQYAIQGVGQQGSPDASIMPVGQPYLAPEYAIRGGPYNQPGTPKWISGGQGGQYPGAGVPSNNQMTGVGNPYAQQGGGYGGGNPYATFKLNANKIRPDQWQNMTNSEKQMLAGQVENAGGNMDDYQQMMQNAWITGRARGTSQYNF